MTKTKLEIIGEYRKDHPGPFCTRDGRPVRILCSDMQNEYSIVAIVLDEDGKETVSTFLDGGRFSKACVDQERDIMCAREVPMPREFWVNEYEGRLSKPFPSLVDAMLNYEFAPIRTIHMIEVLPGENS